jgi:protein ImuA
MLLRAQASPSLPAGGCVAAPARPATPCGIALAQVEPENLHPALWRAHQRGRQRTAVSPRGFVAHDAEQPGGGGPSQVLTELLLPYPGVGEMRLLAPVLARIAGADPPRCVMLFDPPAPLCGWALAQLGVDARQLLVIHGRDGAHGARHLLPSADLLWALEQALKSGHVGAVLAWLPERLRADALRRLQLAAQAHDGPVFVLRDIEARLKPSAAVLRLALHSAGIDALRVRLLKRRGPALAAPVLLALPAVLPRALRARLVEDPLRVRLVEDPLRASLGEDPLRAPREALPGTPHLRRLPVAAAADSADPAAA